MDIDDSTQKVVEETGMDSETVSNEVLEFVREEVAEMEREVGGDGERELQGEVG